MTRRTMMKGSHSGLVASARRAGTALLAAALFTACAADLGAGTEDVSTLDDAPEAQASQVSVAPALAELQPGWKAAARVDDAAPAASTRGIVLTIPSKYSA